jgi:hypothetical protein
VGFLLLFIEFQLEDTKTMLAKKEQTLEKKRQKEDECRSGSFPKLSIQFSLNFFGLTFTLILLVYISWCLFVFKNKD